MFNNCLMGDQTVDFSILSQSHSPIKRTVQLLVKIILLNFADLNEITNNQENELTERKDPLLPALIVGGAIGYQAARKRRKRLRQRLRQHFRFRGTENKARSK